MIFPVPSLGGEEEAAIVKIEALRRDLRFRMAEPRRWLGSVRRVLAARAIQGSNSIEGYNVSVEDAVAALAGDAPSEADKDDWDAVEGYRRAMTYVLRLAHDPHFQYSSQLIRSLHFMMTEDSIDASPGLWREGSVWVQNNVTGDVVYEGPEHQDVPGLVEELIEQLATETGPGMVRGAMAHLNLVMIHPFKDGNGRMSRCLQTLVLAREQVLSPELISIEEYLGRNTQEYYNVLALVGQGSWHPTNDARPWLRFCLEAHYVQAMSVLRRLREAEQIWDAIGEIVQLSHLHPRSITGLFDAAIGLRIRNSSYRATLKATANEEISDQVATNDLSAMVQAGLLARRGQRRGTTYSAAEPLQAIWRRARANRAPIDVSDLFKPPEAQMALPSIEP